SIANYQIRLDTARARPTRKRSGLIGIKRSLPPTGLLGPQDLLGYFHWCADGGILVKCSRHSLRQANAAVGSCKGWYISLMHCVTASKEHGVRHLGAIEMAASRTPILPSVDIRFHDIPIIIHVIAEYG